MPIDSISDIPLEDWDDHHSSRPASHAGLSRDLALRGEVLQASQDRSYSMISRYFEENAEAIANTRRQPSFRRVTDTRIISNAAIPEALVGKDFIYAPSGGEGFTARRRGHPLVHFCVHSFGKSFDINSIKNSTSLSVAADPETGYNPHRFYNGVRVLIGASSRKRVGIHHVISRRGDIVNSVPWNFEARHAGAARGASHPGGVAGSIGLELEMWYVKDSRRRNVNPVLDQVPYADPQMIALAFIFKKWMTWTQQPGMAQWLGPLSEECHARIRAKEPGCFQHSDLRPKGDAGGEFHFPVDWVTGDPMPPGPPSSVPRQYQAWVDRWYGTQRGTPISGWYKLFTLAERMRTPDLQTEIFDTSIEAGRRINLPSPVSPNGTGSTAVAQRQARDMAIGVDRSQRSQSRSRADIYSDAQSTNSALAQTFQIARSNNAAVVAALGTNPVIVDGLGFDYTKGLWVNQTTSNSTPPQGDDG